MLLWPMPHYPVGHPKGRTDSIYETTMNRSLAGPWKNQVQFFLKTADEEFSAFELQNAYSKPTIDLHLLFSI